MASYQTDRDTHSMPMYEFTTQLATLEPPPPDLQQLLGGIHGNQAAMDALRQHHRRDPLARRLLRPRQHLDPDGTASHEPRDAHASRFGDAGLTWPDEDVEDSPPIGG